MSYLKIGLVTACYNHQNNIQETIESVLGQNYPQLKYIVLDDGSTDKSWSIIRKYKDRLYHCQRLKGYRKTVATALNLGFKKLDVDILGWINSDDILLPKSLFVINQVFSQLKNIQWLTGVATTINANTEMVKVSLRRKNKYDYLLKNWSVIQQESTFWRKNLWQKAGGFLNDNYLQAFDSELWTRFFFTRETLFSSGSSRRL